MSINTKIPRIEYVLTLPESIEENFNNILNLYQNNISKSLKILKKNKYRITTNDFVENFKFRQILREIINDKQLDYFDYSIISREQIIDDFKKLLNEKDGMIKSSVNKYLIDYIEKIIEKYLKIIIHIDDQVFISTNKNKEGSKLFVKFFLPKIMTNTVIEENKFALDEVNNNKDNIHATILPATEGHGLDGIFHLTFRIEGRSKTLFEYSKYLSLNRESNKFGFIVYNDETFSDYVIFKLTNEFDKLLEFFKNGFIQDLIDKFFESKVYKDLCDFIVFDIFNKLISDNKIDKFLTRYFHMVGIKIINSIIDRLLKIIFLTFVDLSFI